MVFKVGVWNQVASGTPIYAIVVEYTSTKKFDSKLFFEKSEGILGFCKSKE